MCWSMFRASGSRGSRLPTGSAVTVGSTSTSRTPGTTEDIPAERIGAAALEYLRTGVRAGTVLPDANDPGLSTVRVVA